MKKLLIIALLTMITFLGVNAQQPQRPLPNQFRDYVDFRMQQEGTKHRPIIGSMLPKPKKVIKKKNTIVLVFDKKEFEKFQASRKMAFHRPMMRRPMMWNK